MDTLFGYIQITWGYVRQMLPCALLGVLGFFCLRPHRKKRLAERNLKSSMGRETVLFLFVVFSTGLAALTLFPAGFFDKIYLYFRYGWPINFHSVGEGFYLQITILNDLLRIFRQPHGAWSLFMLLGNIIMFMPFGFFSALVGDRPRWWRALLTGFFVSSFIEFVQLFVGRSCDINDIVLNTFGALCGFWVYLLLKHFAPRFILNFKLQRTEVPNGREAGNKAAL